jgi:hypothetical protein
MRNIAILFCMISSALVAQETVTLQPHYADGNNTYIRNNHPDIPVLGYDDLTAYAWTCDGDLCIGRGFLTFNLDNILPGSTITSANLYLYANQTTLLGFHGEEPQTGTNAAHIFRVTEPWVYNTLVWPTQPDISYDNSVAIPESVDPVQDYIIDVTALIQDWIDDPENSYGLTFRLDDELNYYSSLIFCSSFYPVDSLHPKLMVTYTLPVGINNVEQQQFNIYPNPAQQELTIQFNTVTESAQTLVIYNMLGEVIQEVAVAPQAQTIQVNVNNFTGGLYMVQSATGNAAMFEVVK